MAYKTFEDDDQRVKLGRYSDLEERQLERLFKRNPHLQPTKGPYRGMQIHRHVRQAITFRARTITNGWGNDGFPEAVVKFSSSLKSKRTVISSINYIARLNETDEENDRPEVCDEFAFPLDEDAIRQKIDEWDLQLDESNLSKKARDYIEDGNVKELLELDDNGRLHNIQARHIMFSIESGNDLENESDALKRAATATIDDFFTADGFKVIWALHQDKPEHLHVHAVIKTLSRTGRRLWIDKTGDFKHALRSNFAQNLRAVGLPHQATCREDRWKTREKIMAGIEPLRVGTTKVRTKSPKNNNDGPLQASPEPTHAFNPFSHDWLFGRKAKNTKRRNRAREKVIADRAKVAHELLRIADLDEAINGRKERAERIRQIVESDQQIPIIQTPQPKRIKTSPPVEKTKEENLPWESKEEQILYCDRQGLPLSEERKPSRPKKSRGQER